MILKDIDTDGSPFKSADLLVAGKFTQLLDYAKFLEEELRIQTTMLGFRIAELEKEKKDGDLLLEACQKHTD